MTAVTAVGTSGSNQSGGGGTAPVKRLFDLLEEDSKERVLRTITALHTLTPLEQEAFAQELGMSLPRAVEEQFAARTHPLTGPVLGVRSRDPGYVTLATPVKVITDNRRAELEAMIMPLLTERTVFDSPEVTDESAESMPAKGLHKPTTTSSDEILEERLQTSPSSKNCITNVYNNLQEGEVEGHKEEEALREAPIMYRNRAYQALRLSRGDQQQSGVDMCAKPSVLNLTGMPISESDVWEWFDLLDVTRSGTVGVVPFLEAIKDLDRGFGVSEKAEAKFVEEAEALATDGLLTFEKFAFLVSRLSRE